VTLREKVGQLLMVGFRGLQAGPRSAILRAVEAGLVGGVVLFDTDAALRRDWRNIASPAQLRKLIASLQRAAPLPLLVAVDQEGGRVARLRRRHGFSEAPSARSLGEADDPDATAKAAAATAAMLAEAGCNLNFAPVVDLDSFPDNPVIGRLGRSFGADPLRVVRHARAVVVAHRRFGVACCLKHFPGHGSSRGDSHLGFTDVSDTWRQDEIEPYRALIAEGLADAVMSAHVFNRHLDPELPASLSPAVLGGLLRRELGFAGALFSDDLDMRAVSGRFTRRQALELALNAGNDVLLVGNNLAFDAGAAGRAVAAILEAEAAGRIDSRRIAEACGRVLELKARLAAPARKP